MMLVQAFLVLLVSQLLGEALGRTLHLGVPGPVIGMLLLAGWYAVRRREPGEAMKQMSDGLLGWLGLLFVPAGVGVVTQLGELRKAWLPVSVALTVSTLCTLLLTACIMHWFARKQA